MSKLGVPGVPEDAADARPRGAASLFFASWLRAPFKVASIVPSSRHLGAAIADQIDPAHPGWVVELGAGTGPVTERLLARYGVDKVHAVVCGIPLLSMPKADATRLVRTCLDILEPDGRLYQYTYSLFSPLPYRELGLAVRRVRRILFNIPPAAVWTYGLAESRA